MDQHPKFPGGKLFFQAFWAALMTAGALQPGQQRQQDRPSQLPDNQRSAPARTLLANKLSGRGTLLPLLQNPIFGWSDRQAIRLGRFFDEGQLLKGAVCS